jgi:hypothetical protein
MNNNPANTNHPPPRRHRGSVSLRAGFSMLEVFVACTLLSSVLAVSTPLIVRHGRLLKAQRNYRLALDELSNQLERLRALPPAEMRSAAASVAPSEFAKAKLPGVKLRAELEAFDLGQRLTISATWNEVERERAPLSLAAWVFAEARAAAVDSAGEESP